MLQALCDCGFNAVEQGTSLPLYGYHGDKRPETADLVIRRQHTGVMQSNDIGFAYDHTRKGYVPIVSEYDTGAVRGGKFIVQLRTAYSKRVIETVTKRIHGTQKATTEGGVIRIRVRF